MDKHLKGELSPTNRYVVEVVTGGGTVFHVGGPSYEKCVNFINPSGAGRFHTLPDYKCSIVACEDLPIGHAFRNAYSDFND